MSNDSFKVKKSLTLTPARMVDIINPQAGDLACDIDDNNKIKRYNDQKLSWEEIGSGGQDSSQLLDNGGFEEVERSWTLTAGVSSINPDPVVGDYCLEVSLADEALELFQDSTLNQTALSDGVQGLAYIRVKTALSGIKVCFRQAGVTSTSLCVDVNNNNKWGLYKLPVILGGTSNGIAVTSEGVVKTGTIIVDDAFVGAQDVKQDAVKIESQSEARVEVASIPVGDITGVNNLPSFGDGLYFYNSVTGKYLALKKISATLSLSLRSSTTAPVFTAIVVNSNVVSESSSPATASQYTSASWGGIINKGEEFYFRNSGTGTAGVIRLSVLATTADNTSIYSTASDSFSTDTNTLTHKPSVAITAADPIGTFNTYSYAANSNTKTICTAAPSTAPSKTDGFRIFTRAYNAASTCGNPARVEIKIAQAGTSLPTAQSLIFKNTGKDIAGATELYPLSSTVLRGFFIDGYDPTTGIYTADAGISETTNTARQFFFNDVTTATSGYLVINAQKMKDAIVGDFTNIEKCADDYECTDTFSAKVSSTDVVTDQNIDWINGNCTNATAGRATCNFNPGIFTVAPNCVATWNSGASGGRSVQVLSASSSSVTLNITVSSTGAAANEAFTLICQKQGADYKPKTAKIASSIGAVKSEGASGEVEIISVTYSTGGSANCTSSPCVINQIGGAVTSVTRASTGAYSLNLAKTYNKLKCTFQVLTAGVVMAQVFNLGSCDNCSSLSFRTYRMDTRVIADTAGNLNCIGELP